jgi:hypothetical protein
MSDLSPLLDFALLQSLTRTEPLVCLRCTRRRSVHELLSWGSSPLQRSRRRGATYTGFASPGCAAPSGFLTLLTLSSPRCRSGPVSCRWRSWGSPYRGFPSRTAGRASRPPCPSWRCCRRLPLTGVAQARLVLHHALFDFGRLPEGRPSSNPLRRTSRARLQGVEPDRESVLPVDGG